MLEGVSVNIMFFCSTCCVKVPQALQTYSDNVASPSLDQKLQNLSAATSRSGKRIEGVPLSIVNPPQNHSKFKTSPDF